MNKLVAQLHQHLPSWCLGYPSISHLLCHCWRVAGDRRDTSTECTKAAQRASFHKREAQGGNQDSCFPPATLILIFPGAHSNSLLFFWRSQLPPHTGLLNGISFPTAVCVQGGLSGLRSFVLSDLLFLSALCPSCVNTTPRATSSGCLQLIVSDFGDLQQRSE